MKILSRSALLALAAALTLAGPAGAATADLDRVLAKNHAARGGIERLRAVETARITGVLSMMDGQTRAPFVWEWKQPDRTRLELIIQGVETVQAYDGESGWMIMPFTGVSGPQEMPPDQLDALREQSDFAGPLVDPEEKGYTLELVGEETVRDTRAHVIRVTDEDGDVQHLYLDAESGLEIRSRARRTLAGEEMEVTTLIGNYKKVDGLLLAHSYDVEMPGEPGGQSLTFGEVELNVELPDSRFEVPAPTGGSAPPGPPPHPRQ